MLGDVATTIRDLEAFAHAEEGAPSRDLCWRCWICCKTYRMMLDCHRICSVNQFDAAYHISKYVVNANQWKYDSVAGNPQPANDHKGGQASIDTKYGYKGNKDSGELVVSVKIE
eukprot:468085_1